MDVRRRTMQAVKSKHTGLELIFRKLVHRLGYRFRLHRTNLPGKPDLVFVGRKKAVFVHGSFGTGMSAPAAIGLPKANAEYWFKKISGNKERDRIKRGSRDFTILNSTMTRMNSIQT